MTWRPDIANDLPAPRDDEPSSLRQDIADELSDHLHSSFAGELHRTPDQTEAKQNVLDRFGDPRRVARQLWFDAMKEKIMSQRLLITALVVTAIACLGSTGLTFMLVEQSRQASQALVDQVERSQKSNEAFLKETREANAALVEKLSALVGPAGKPDSTPATSMEWNPVKIRLVTTADGRPPAVGYEVILEGHVLDSASKNSIARKTDPGGIADFGVVRPGQHNLSITTPWQESREASITVLPGKSLTEEFVCPSTDRSEVPISVSVDWPDDLRDRRLCIVCLARQAGRQIDQTEWSPEPETDYRLLVVTAANQMLSFRGDRALLFGPGPLRFMNGRPKESPGLYYDKEPLSYFLDRKRSDAQATTVAVNSPVRPYFFQFPDAPSTPQERLTEGQYLILHMLVGDDVTDEAIRGRRKVNVVGGLTETPVHISFGEFIQTRLNFPFATWSRPRRIGLMSEEGAFEVKAQPGASSQMKIPIPEKLAELVRSFLEESK